MGSSMSAKGRVAIAGYRSWISRELTEVIESKGIWVDPLPKEDLGTEDLTRYDCVYLVLGRANPSSSERDAEERQVEAFLDNPRKPSRVVYVSSRRLTESKSRCETALGKYKAGERGPATCLISVLRPPAVFGPKQSLQSDMLIPSLVRTDGEAYLYFPENAAEFISVRDLAEHMAKFSDLDWWDVNQSGSPWSISVIPGTVSMTPNQVRSLYKAFAGLIMQRD